MQVSAAEYLLPVYQVTSCHSEVKKYIGVELVFRLYFENYACHKPDVPQIAQG
jgi:hypothetical protein